VRTYGRHFLSPFSLFFTLSPRSLAPSTPGKSNPFGGAKPVDTTKRLEEVEAKLGEFVPLSLLSLSLSLARSPYLARTTPFPHKHKHLSPLSRLLPLPLPLPRSPTPLATRARLILRRSSLLLRASSRARGPRM
jgi:hypothetical protein